MFTYKNLKISILVTKGRSDWKETTALWAVFDDWEGTTVFQDAPSIFYFFVPFFLLFVPSFGY